MHGCKGASLVPWDACSVASCMETTRVLACGWHVHTPTHPEKRHARNDPPSPACAFVASTVDPSIFSTVHGSTPLPSSPSCRVHVVAMAVASRRPRASPCGPRGKLPIHLPSDPCYRVGTFGSQAWHVRRILRRWRLSTSTGSKRKDTRARWRGGTWKEKGSIARGKPRCDVAGFRRTRSRWCRNQ